MTEALRIACPSCGGTLPLPEGRTLVDCRYCGGRAKVDVPGHILRVVARPLVDRRRLHDILSAWFVDPETPRDMNRLATLRSAELFYAPVYEVRGIRGSIRRTKREARWVETDVRGDGIDDSVVGLTEFAFATAATRVPGWGLEHLDAAAIRGADSPAEFVPFDAAALAESGTVLAADRPVADAKAELSPSLAADHAQATEERIESRMGLLYVPIWRVSYLYRDRLFSATVEAVTGAMLSARFPENDHFRLPYFLASAALVGWTVGGVARITWRLATGWGPTWGPVAANPLTLLAAIGVMFLVPLALNAVLAASWKMLRYPAEIVVRGNRRFREWIVKPGKSVFDRVMERQLAVLNALFDGLFSAERRR